MTSRMKWPGLKQKSPTSRTGHIGITWKCLKPSNLQHFTNMNKISCQLSYPQYWPLNWLLIESITYLSRYIFQIIYLAVYAGLSQIYTTPWAIFRHLNIRRSLTVHYVETQIFAIRDQSTLKPQHCVEVGLPHKTDYHPWVLGDHKLRRRPSSATILGYLARIGKKDPHPPPRWIPRTNGMLCHTNGKTTNTIPEHLDRNKLVKPHDSWITRVLTVHNPLPPSEKWAVNLPPYPLRDGKWVHTWEDDLFYTSAHKLP